MSKPPSSKNPSSTSKTGKTVSNKTTEALFTWVAGKNDTKDEKASKGAGAAKSNQIKPDNFPTLLMSPKSFGRSPCLSLSGLWFCAGARRKAFTKRLVRLQAVANAKSE
jgi:hypothetical protein